MENLNIISQKTELIIQLMYFDQQGNRMRKFRIRSVFDISRCFSGGYRFLQVHPRWFHGNDGSD